ncbi:hypothetical protein PAXRUDRAFT_243518 [Paxillus rubicundulus Ve08.2h10]|uniref:Uncharacterized protein n=1 Tax=Paxillus rubicundulus Ve08.2h10 TaxID=930991 RepID=A0A0D0CXH4_9AGAM|nr:hypothetical protein PAXRUDRAFT_243518 [Paxillus rubicundulus Ve08.2h10]
MSKMRDTRPIRGYLFPAQGIVRVGFWKRKRLSTHVTLTGQKSRQASTQRGAVSDGPVRCLDHFLQSVMHQQLRHTDPFQLHCSNASKKNTNFLRDRHYCFRTCLPSHAMGRIRHLALSPEGSWDVTVHFQVPNVLKLELCGGVGITSPSLRVG